MLRIESNGERSDSNVIKIEGTPATSIDGENPDSYWMMMMMASYLHILV